MDAGAVTPTESLSEKLPHLCFSSALNELIAVVATGGLELPVYHACYTSKPTETMNISNLAFHAYHDRFISRLMRMHAHQIVWFANVAWQGLHLD